MSLDEIELKRKEAQEKLTAKLKILFDEGITGVLFNVDFTHKIAGDPRYPNLSGIVDIDTQGRFYFGEKVYTSRLERIYVENGRTFAKTRYSLYELIGFDPVEIPKDFEYAFS